MANTFGPKAIVKKTPMWAKWMFRVVFILTTAVTFVVAGDPGIPDNLKIRIAVYLKGFDMLIYGFSKLFGEEIDKPDTDNP